MRIAMILRPDADRVFGGDTVVMRKLSAAMCAQGVDVVVGRMDEMPPAREFDLLHIFALAPVDHAEAMIAWAQGGDAARWERRHPERRPPQTAAAVEGCEPVGRPFDSGPSAAWPPAQGASPLPASGSAAARGRAAVVFSPLYYSDFRDWFERAAVTVPRWRALARRLGKPVAWRLYRAWQTARLPYQSGWRRMRAALRAADVIATTSQWENGWLAGHFRLPADVRRAMCLSPLGIDAELYGRTFGEAELAAFRARYGLPTGYVAQVARLEEKKNQLAVIQALYDERIPLVFVGRDSPYYAAGYGDRCRALGAQRGGVHFIEWLPEAELPLLYANAAAHILPSWVEQPGLTSLEAGASGTRVISTAVSGLSEILGGDAWYCDPYDPASIRTTVHAALASPLSATLRPTLLARHGWAQAAAANLALYADVLRRRQRSTSI